MGAEGEEKIGLPEEWCQVSIDDVTVKGEQRKPEEMERLIYVDIGSIDRETKKISKPQVLIGKNAPSRARKLIRSGDVLVSLTRPNLNAVALVSENYNGQFASTGFEVLRPVKYESRLLYSITKSKGFIDAISGTVQGALYPAAKSADVKAYKIPLPPLAEQTQIAQTLDTLLTQVDNIKTRLDAIPKILKTFRQSVLAAAVSGKLTEEWRGEGVWKPVTLGEAGRGFNYGSSAKSQKEGDVPVLRMGNLQEGKLDWGSLVYTSDESEIEKYMLKEGDVLFNRTNSPELVGKTSIYRGERKSIYAGYLIKVEGSDLLSSEFINILLNSPQARVYCRAVKSDGVSQSNINAQKLRAFKFNLPGMMEQTQIVHRVEELFTFADQIEQQVKNAQARVNHLTQSVLAKAFRGELTAQWRKDNPDLISGENSAEALLAKIQVEREKLKPKKTIRNKTARKTSAKTD